MNCHTCGKELKGRQKLYCSRRCHNAHGNVKHQNYAAQKKRGNIRQMTLIKNHGMKCVKCGYSRNRAALSFHHLDPTEKSFPLDIRNCSNRDWDSLLEESTKCALLCANCHLEEHHPSLEMSLCLAELASWAVQDLNL